MCIKTTHLQESVHEIYTPPIRQSDWSEFPSHGTMWVTVYTYTYMCVSYLLYYYSSLNSASYNYSCVSLDQLTIGGRYRQSLR